MIHHTTFFVNSIAHLYGARPYTEANSARDNAWVALLTNGEGYHNFHHRFPADFRNGIRWYHWDPSKWWIRVLELAGLRAAAAPHAGSGDRALAPADGGGSRRDELAEAPADLHEAIRQPARRRAHSLERAAVLWTQLQEQRRQDWKQFREHLSDARTHRREALRMLAAVARSA